MLQQSLLPDRIVVWLVAGTKIPRNLARLQKYGVEIRFCQDYGTQTKLVPALLEFPDDVLITIDDDSYYNSDWSETITKAHHSNPDAIIGIRCLEITLDENKNIRTFKEWKSCENNMVRVDYTKNNRLFLEGHAGILYPPHSLDTLCTEKDIFMELAPKADDLWFWAMAKLKGTKYLVLDYKQKRPLPIQVISNEKSLWSFNAIGGNDMQLKLILERYPEIKEKII